MDYNSAWMFLKVAKTGSFTKAAKEMDVPKSTVSKRVAELEASLQVTLLRRTTRNIDLTEVGREFFAKCSKAFSELRNAEIGTQSVLVEPAGVLRVTAPSELGQGLMTQVLSDFLKKYPKVTLELLLGGEHLDFVRDNIDVAIRIGNLRDSSLMCRRIGVNRFRLVASPEYLKNHPPIRRMEDLKKHSTLIFSSLQDPHVWDLKSASKKVRARVQGRYVTNNLTAIKEMAMAGLGITLMPMVLCKAEIEAKQLEIILPNWVAHETPVNFLYQKEFFTAPKITAFIDFVAPAVRPIFEPS